MKYRFTSKKEAISKNIQKLYKKHLQNKAKISVYDVILEIYDVINQLHDVIAHSKRLQLHTNSSYQLSDKTQNILQRNIT